jgi:hypothetical protein
MADCSIEFVAQFAGGIAGVYVLDAVTPFPMNVAPSLVDPSRLMNFHIIVF